MKAGYAVLAPFNLSTIDKRNRIERLARVAGTTLARLEFARMQALLTAVLEDRRTDSNRAGIWGISQRRDERDVLDAARAAVQMRNRMRVVQPSAK